MCRKDLEHIASVTLRYFFNLDFVFVRQLFMIVLLLPFVSRLVAHAIGAYFYEGLLTVKDDTLEIRNSIAAFLDAHDVHINTATLAENLRTMKTQLLERHLHIH